MPKILLHLVPKKPNILLPKAIETGFIARFFHKV